MYWIDKVVKSSAVVLALVSVSVGEAAALVVRSNGPSAVSFPPGKALPDNGSIALKAGDSVTVLDAKGTRVLNGPGSLSVAGTGVANASSFAALLANNGARQSRTGVTRGAAAGASHATNVWYVDSSRAGTICVLDPNNVALWRPSMDAAGSMTLTRLSDGKTAKIDFRVGQAVQPWPIAEVPVTEGSRYRLNGAEPDKSVTITMTMLSVPPDGLDGAAQVLLRKHCMAQLDLLVAATMQDQDR